jgi:hypothetical protein
MSADEVIEARDGRSPSARRWQFAGWSLAVLAVVLVVTGPCLPFRPDLAAGRDAANRAADRAHLEKIYSLLVLQDRRGGASEGGHRLLTDLWTRGVIEPTPEQLEFFFVPGRREQDLHYRELRERLDRGERIWTDSAATTSRDTHYAALATPFLAHLFDKEQVIAADDCEDGWPFAVHVIHLLYGDGRVREMAFAELPVLGPSSPLPELQRLER